ncbi:hypothetical protein FRC17_007563 [Serendipita sp. 399]|nr:hypothetical protein FRC17_007563 [Serendipita sp. 399]
MSAPGNQKADDEPLREVMGISSLFSAIEIGLSYGDGRKGAWSLWVACVASVSTFLFQQVAMNVGEATEEKRKGTAVPSFFNSITHALLCIPFTLLWLAAAIILLVNILSHRQSVKVVVWVDLAFAIINMCIVGVQGVLTIYYRKKFFDKLKHAQLQATASVVAEISIGYPANEPPPTRSYPRLSPYRLYLNLRLKHYTTQ